MNLFEQAIELLSPGRAAERQEARGKLQRLREREQRDSIRHDRWVRRFAGGGFESAEPTRDAHSWFTSKISIQSALEVDREEMLERSNSTYKNFELGTALVEGRTDRVVGQGTSLDAEIVEVPGEITADQAEQWNDILRDNWDRQVERISKHGKALWRVQRTLQRHEERHGEWFVLIGDKEHPLNPTSLRIEVIHPNRVETPPGKEGDEKVRMGIQLDGDGNPIGCYIREKHPHDNLEVGEDYTYYPFEQSNGLKRVIHHFEEYEEGQRRGWPRHQVGMKRLKNAEEYSEAELERNYAGACVVGAVRTDVDTADLGDVQTADGKKVKDMAPGQWQYLGETDSVEFNNPSGAPSTYPDYMRYQAQMYAVGAGTSYEVLTQDLRGLSYSTIRVLWNLEEATCNIKHLAHAELIVEIYRHFVTRAISQIPELADIDIGAYRSRPWLYWAARVIMPAKPSVDPSREDRNELVLAEAGIKPASDIAERKTGKRAAAVYKRVARDREMRRGLKLEEHMPNMGRDPVPPSDVAPTQPGDRNDASSDANQERAVTQ